MKPPPFRYVRATSLDQAIGALSAAAGEAKLLAGGQSLVPMLNFRLARPEILVDINPIRQLEFVSERSGGGLRIGALARHHTLATSTLVAREFPVLAEAMTHVGHLAIRNRGTIGGSLAHADPAAELPMLAMLLDASVITAGPTGGRTIPARDFFIAPLTTALADDEIITVIELPPLRPRTGWGFEELAQRRGDFAIAAAGATLTLSEGRCIEARLALIGGPVPVRATAAERLLQEQTLDPKLIRAAAHAARQAVTPEATIHASAEFRTHLVGVLAERALRAAWKRAALAPAAH